MHRPRSSIPLALALALAPLVAAAADELPGLDLSEPEKPPEAPAPPAAPRADRAPAEDASADEEPRAGAPQVLGSPGERDAALSDRVKAVQRKGFLKRGRWELGASLPATVNDAFYQKVGGGVRVAYHLHDTFALRLRADFFEALRTGRIREGKIAFSSQLLASELSRQVLLDGMWSPIYGKINWLGSHIVHFDVFLAAGFGGAWSATSDRTGPHLAGDVGGGLRFYPSDWLALEGGISATFYPDQPAASVPSSMQRVVAANLAVSIFFPFSFEYRYP
jgi:outer membrane beta-barrel protein